MERDQYVLKYFCRTGNFNSHAHVERDTVDPNAIREIRISTHTLTWSVTAIGEYLRGNVKISTHTLTWSVTAFFAEICYNQHISTHTLTWSVTYVLSEKSD